MIIIGNELSNTSKLYSGDVMKKCKFIGLVLLMMLYVSCVTSEEDDKYGYNYSVDETKKKFPSVDDENKPPSSIVRIQNYISGDTFVMVSGKILKLAGIAAPKTGEPYFKKAKDYAHYLIGLKMLRLVWVKDTKKIDNIWKVNIIISKSGNMISVTEQMVKYGLAEVTAVEPTKFQTLDLKNDGKL
ncbi:MAG: thermonuclease family protein, partial [Candidatus Heimdallarchaeota archaeon]|nr:thermonuclease family protein [Candidatus Heimdallarchaeota archaeon]